MTFKEKVSSVYYTHGLFCASHPLTFFAITFGCVFLCCHPLSKLPFPGNPPLQHTTATKAYVVPDGVRQTLERDDVASDSQRPMWYAGPSAAYILQIVVKSTVSPWQRQKLYPSDAFRTPLMKTFDILDVVNKQRIRNGDSVKDIGDFCLQISETLPDRGVNKLLPQYNCLTLSPANIWQLDRTKFDQDGELVKTVYTIAHTFDKTPLLKDILFGMAWPETGMSRFYVRNRQRVISYAVTIVMKHYDEDFVSKLRDQLYEHYPLHRDNTTIDEEQMTHVYFKARTYFFMEYTPLMIAYVVLFLYIYFSVRKIQMVKSKWGLALASVAMIVASLFMSIGICTFLGLQPILLGARIYEIFPYLVVIVGLENVLILTKSVVSTPVHMDVKYRVAQGLYKEGWGITKNLVCELLILLLGFATWVPEIQEFCLFACVGLLSDFFLQMMFFCTVLGIDIRRMELTDLRATQTGVVTSEFKHPEPILHCPYRQFTQSPARRRMERSRSFPHAGFVHEQPQLTSNRLRLMEYIARYRLVQRLLMLGTALWIAFILYQTGLAAHMIYKSMNTTGNEQQQAQHNPQTTTDDATVKLEDNLEWTLVHEGDDHWTRLSHAHWPTLFGFYNVSLWNRYITILPPVRLSIAVHPDVAAKFRHPEETKSNLDWLPPAPQTGDWLPPSDWLPPGLDPSADNPTKQLLLQAKRFYPRTRREFYVTVVLAVASSGIIAYLMVSLYGCMCSRNYSKWREGWRESGAQRRGRKFSEMKQLFRPGPAVHLHGHQESVECITCNGQMIMTSCLAGEIRVWDSLSGQCTTFIPSDVSHQPLHSTRDQLMDPSTDIETDFTETEISQTIDPFTGYDFTPYCSNNRLGKRMRSKTASDMPREPLEPKARSYSADSRGEVKPTERHTQIWSMACQDTLIAVGCGDGRLELWDSRNGQLKCTHTAPTISSSVRGATNSGITHMVLKGGRLIIARLDGHIDFLLLETYIAASVGGNESQKIYMRGHLRVHSGSWSRDNVLGSNDLITCSLLSSTRAHSRSLTGLSCEGGRVVSTSLDSSIKVYKLDDCMCLYTLHGHEAPVTALCLDEQSPLGAITGCSRGTVLVWDLLTGACVHKLVHGEASRTCAIISVLCTPAHVVSTRSDHDLCIWDRCRGLRLHNIRLDYLTTQSLSMLTSHLMICASMSGDLHVWDISKPELVRVIELRGEKPAHTVLTVGNGMAICDLGNQVVVIPFPSGLGKVE